MSEKEPFPAIHAAAIIKSFLKTLPEEYQEDVFNIIMCEPGEEVKIKCSVGEIPVDWNMVKIMRDLVNDTQAG